MKKSLNIFTLFLAVSFTSLSAAVLSSSKFVTTPDVYKIGIKRIDFQKTDSTWHTYADLTNVTYAVITDAAMSGDIVKNYAATSSLPAGSYQAVRVVFLPSVVVSGAAWNGSTVTCRTESLYGLRDFLNIDNSAMYDLRDAFVILDGFGTTLLDGALLSAEEVNAILPTNADGKTQVGLNGETIDGQYYYHLISTFASNPFTVVSGGSIPTIQLNFDVTNALEFEADFSSVIDEHVLTVAVPVVVVFVEGVQVSP